MPSRRVRTLLLLASACLVLAACGGDDEGGNTIPGGDSGSGPADVVSPGDTSGGGGGDTGADPRGKLGGPCYPNGTCDGTLECADGVCVSPSVEGQDGGPCYPNGTCNAGLACENGVCAPMDQGQEGGPCFPNDTCDAGLVCVNGVCVQPGSQGEENGPCYPNGTCNAGLVCTDGVCVPPTQGQYAWQNPCTPGGPKRDGQTCADHCECQSGYCYDEGYLDGFRFCTRRCDGFEHECVKEGDVETYVCTLFSGPWVDELDPPVHLRNFCLMRCTSNEQCEQLDPAWDACVANSTEWEGHTIALPRTCVVYGQ